ncbi:sigma-70 family RNA polymerase sigma factor [Fodinibius halophilus]|uniref:RNA polymerase sigma factor n=1 Tax=Fodinibius halophilus TaxID=1736908 RepID=A0A6M1T3H5_9BACT|nr:sigma-70 family RNA polymerase sigma factor [Fodinibius halophilus]NGP88637.1 sigma-70 family RNA polymerase sigma factor [Fodinibius halophilus]
MAKLTKDELQKQEDFEEEIIPHLDAMYNFALRLTSDPSDAEDLVQDTIVKAFRFFSSYEKGTNAKAWLFRILKNSYINNYRKKSKQPNQVDYDEVATFYETIRAERTDTSDLEDKMFRDLIDDDISNALEELPEDFRTVVLLCDIEDFTYEEIANMLDVPIGTIRSRLHRGRNLLKDQLVEYAEKRGYQPDPE